MSQTCSTYPLHPVLLSESFHCKLMNGLETTGESPRKFRNILAILGSLHGAEHISSRTRLPPAYGHEAVPNGWISIVFLSRIVMADDWGFCSQRWWKDWQQLKEMRWKGWENALLAHCQDVRIRHQNVSGWKGSCELEFKELLLNLLLKTGAWLYN